MKSRRRLLILGAGLLAIALLLAGGRRLPTGPAVASLPPISGVRSIPAELHVATFNIHGCKGIDGRRDVARVAQLVEGLDVVGLCEVRGSAWSNPADQAAALEEYSSASGRESVYAPAETRWFGTARFGNGLLTTQPIAAWERIPLPRRHDKSYRNMLLARLDMGLDQIAVLVTHIPRSNDRERRIHLELVLERFVSLAPPAVLLADLNTPPSDPRMKRFLAETDAVDAIAARSDKEEANNRVDWILVRGLECLAAERIDTEASDHPLFTARMAVPQRKTASGWKKIPECALPDSPGIDSGMAPLEPNGVE